MVAARRRSRRGDQPAGWRGDSAGKQCLGSAAWAGSHRQRGHHQRGKLAAQYVIHAVGPVWGSGSEEQKLGSAVSSILTLAEDHQLTSISIPGISSGIFGGPKDICARLIISTALDYLQQHPATSLKEVRFCNIDEVTASTFVQEAQKLLSHD